MAEWTFQILFIQLFYKYLFDWKKLMYYKILSFVIKHIPFLMWHRSYGQMK